MTVTLIDAVEAFNNRMEAVTDGDGARETKLGFAFGIEEVQKAFVGTDVEAEEFLRYAEHKVMIVIAASLAEGVPLELGFTGLYFDAFLTGMMLAELRQKEEAKAAS